MLNKIYKNFTFKTFTKNRVIYRKDMDLSKKLCVVLDGNIVDKGTNRIVGSPYKILFESNVANGREYIIKNDLIAESNCVIAEANYENIKNNLGGHNKGDKNLSNSNEMVAIEKIRLFTNLDMRKKELIQKNLKTEKFNNGVKILIQGTFSNKLYIMI